MTIARTAIELINRGLALANLKLDSMTSEKQRWAALDVAAQRGAFTKQAYPTPSCFANVSYQWVLDQQAQYRTVFDSFKSTASNAVGYQFGNYFYTSPDAEVLYTIIRTLQPKTILEIGCGNSTRITRQAIRDGQLASKLICLDPFPRRDVADFADQLHLKPVEDSNALELVQALQPGDVLFIDTSHDVRPANDCAYIYGVLIPAVKPGVIVHIHDIFLPYDYPEYFARGDGASWGEQTVVAMMLQSEQWDAIWPGRYLQTTVPDFSSYFPNLDGRLAQSLWLKRR
jgi:predicted O-methyltransferase YrrM